MDMKLRPGDFPLGSLESRMAVRAEIGRAEDSRPFLRVFTVGHPAHDCEGKWCFKPLDVEAGNPIMGKLSLGACHLSTGELVVFPDGRVGFNQPMNIGGAHGRT
jgi:hypothetical protein